MAELRPGNTFRVAGCLSVSRDVVAYQLFKAVRIAFSLLSLAVLPVL
jgi:hypothetical protein